MDSFARAGPAHFVLFACVLGMHTVLSLNYTCYIPPEPKTEQFWCSSKIGSSKWHTAGTDASNCDQIMMDNRTVRACTHCKNFRKEVSILSEEDQEITRLENVSCVGVNDGKGKWKVFPTTNSKIKLAADGFKLHICNIESVWFYGMFICNRKFQLKKSEKPKQFYETAEKELLKLLPATSTEVSKSITSTEPVHFTTELSTTTTKLSTSTTKLSTSTTKLSTSTTKLTTSSIESSTSTPKPTTSPSSTTPSSTSRTTSTTEAQHSTHAPYTDDKTTDDNDSSSDSLFDAISAFVERFGVFVLFALTLAVMIIVAVQLCDRTRRRRNRCRTITTTTTS